MEKYVSVLERRESWDVAHVDYAYVGIRFFRCLDHKREESMCEYDRTEIAVLSYENMRIEASFVAYLTTMISWMSKSWSGCEQ